MLKKYELYEPTSCLNRANADEPVFVLRANDPLFAATIRHWASMSCGVRSPDRIDEALRCAEEGAKWREERQPKTEAASQMMNQSNAAGGLLGGAIGSRDPYRVRLP